MYRITYVLGGLEDSAHARRVLGILLGTQARCAEAYLRAHPEVPSLARSGVRLHDDPQGPKRPGTEWRQDVPTSLAEGYASGFDLAAWRSAELRTREGVAAAPYVGIVGTRKDGGLLHRALVRLPDGRLEDPGGAPCVLYPRERVAFVLGLFDRDRERQLSDDTLQIMLDGITDVDTLYLADHPEVPRLYADDLDVVYQEEPPNCEDFQDVPTCLRKRKADCDDVAPWLAAERRVRDRVPGALCRAYGKRRDDGGIMYHARTLLPGGRWEDPSAILGMR